MAQKSDKQSAIAACFKKYIGTGKKSAACRNFTAPDQCTIVGEITPQSRHLCWLAGYAEWVNDRVVRYGKDFPQPPCE